MTWKNLSQVMGVVWILISILWAGLGVAGIIYLSEWLDGLQTSLDDNITIVVETLETIDGIVADSASVISSTHQSLGTVQVSVHDASVSLSELRPLLWKTTKVVTTEVPDALDGVKESMPTIIETAKSVDEALTWLSSLKLTIPNPLGSDWEYDLGIQYSPDVPLDRALNNMSSSLDEIPDDLRDLDESLAKADSNLLLVSDDLAYLAGDIERMNREVDELVPRMEEIRIKLNSVQTEIEGTQNRIPESFKKARNIILAILGLVILTQVPSIFLGSLFVSGVLFSRKSTEKNQMIQE